MLCFRVVYCSCIVDTSKIKSGQRLLTSWRQKFSAWVRLCFYGLLVQSISLLDVKVESFPSATGRNKIPQIVQHEKDAIGSYWRRPWHRAWQIRKRVQGQSYSHSVMVQKDRVSLALVRSNRELDEGVSCWSSKRCNSHPFLVLCLASQLFQLMEMHYWSGRLMYITVFTSAITTFLHAIQH